MEVETIIVMFQSNVLQAQRAVYRYYHGPDGALDITTTVASGINLCLLAFVAVIYYSNHPRCVQLRRQAKQVLAQYDIHCWNKHTNKSAQSFQAVSIAHLKRQSDLERHQACVVIQSRIRGIIVRSILAGQGLPTLARAVVQEDGVQLRRGAAQRSESRMLESTGSSVHEDCRNLIAALHEKQEEDEANALRDRSVEQFGTQVKAVMRVRMRLLAAVVLQSWFRMIKCRMGYRRIFSSMNTAVITNLPSFNSPRKQDFHEGLSFISSLSSWSSTWNRRQPARTDAVNSYLVTSISSSLEPAFFKPTKEEKEALKQSIDSYASAYVSIVQLQAWWRGSLARYKLHHPVRRGPNLNVMSDNTVASPLEVYGRKKREGSYESENTLRTSNIDERKFRTQRASAARRRRRHPNQYYTDLLRSTLERVTECHSMCNSAINSTVSMDGSTVEKARAFYNDNANYEAIMSRVTNAANEIPDCAAVPSFCAEEAQKHIDAGDCDWMTKGDALLESARTNALQCVDQISALKTKRNGKRGKGNDVACEDPSLYYVQSDIEPLDVEPLSSANTNASTAQSMHEYSSPSSVTRTFSSTAPNALSSPSSYTFRSVETDETSHHSSSDDNLTARRNQRKNYDFHHSSSDDNLTARHQRKNYAFCAAPAPTSMSESSNTSSDCDSYYSIDDGDLQNDNDDDSYGPFPIKLRNRRLIRRTVPRAQG
jgi:IQ calmodulin-binding motif